MKKYLSFLALSFVIPLAAKTYTANLGYGVSPVGHPGDFSQFGTFLQEVANTCNGGVVMANTSWRDSLECSGNVPTLQKTVSQLQPVPYNYTDVDVFGWATYPVLHLNTVNDPTNNWSNNDMKNLFLQALIRSADSLAPAYVFIGNEVNFYLTQDSLDYQNWAAFYSMAYDSIKVHSPNTKVGTIFNYEHLSGQGANNFWTQPHWNAFTDLDTSKMDVIGFTLYPFFNYQHANNVASTYLDPLFAHTGNKPVAFTETGWPGDSLYGNWFANAQEQVDWVNKFFSLTSGHNVQFQDWLFLNYMVDHTSNAASLIFKSVAMRDSMNNDRPALAVWQSYCPNVGVASPSADEQISVYPIPATEQIHFQIGHAHESDAVILIYNSEGTLVKELEINENSTGVDVRDLSPGIYFYRIEKENAMCNGKFIVVADR